MKLKTEIERKGTNVRVKQSNRKYDIRKEMKEINKIKKEPERNKEIYRDRETDY